jgi:hypothetical protein
VEGVSDGDSVKAGDRVLLDIFDGDRFVDVVYTKIRNKLDYFYKGNFPPLLTILS